MGEDQGGRPGDLRRAALRDESVPGRGAQIRHAPLRPRHLLHALDGELNAVVVVVVFLLVFSIIIIARKQHDKRVWVQQYSSSD